MRYQFRRVITTEYDVKASSRQEAIQLLIAEFRRYELSNGNIEWYEGTTRWRPLKEVNK